MGQSDFSRGHEVGGRRVLLGAITAGLPLSLLGSFFLGAWEPLDVMALSFGVTVLGGVVAGLWGRKKAGG